MLTALPDSSHLFPPAGPFASLPLLSSSPALQPFASSQLAGLHFLEPSPPPAPLLSPYPPQHEMYYAQQQQQHAVAWAAAAPAAARYQPAAFQQQQQHPYAATQAQYAAAAPPPLLQQPQYMSRRPSDGSRRREREACAGQSSLRPEQQQLYAPSALGVIGSRATYCGSQQLQQQQQAALSSPAPLTGSYLDALTRGQGRSAEGESADTGGLSVSALPGAARDVMPVFSHRSLSRPLPIETEMRDRRERKVRRRIAGVSSAVRRHSAASG